MPVFTPLSSKGLILDLEAASSRSASTDDGMDRAVPTQQMLHITPLQGPRVVLLPQRKQLKPFEHIQQIA